MLFLPFVLPTLKFKTENLEESDLQDTLDASMISRGIDRKNRIKTVSMRFGKSIQPNTVSIWNAAIMFLTAPVIKFYYRVVDVLKFNLKIYFDKKPF